MALTGAIDIDGVVWRFIGPDVADGGIDAPAMPQVSVSVQPLRTLYCFATAAVQLNVTFTTPALPSELDLLALPVTYITYSVASRDGQAHTVRLYYDNTGEVAVNSVDQRIVWQAMPADAADPQLAVLRIGSYEQKVLGRTGDAVKIDWGYAYVAAHNASGDVRTSAAGSRAARSAFCAGDALPPFDHRMPRRCDDDWPVLSVVWELGRVGGAPVERSLVFAYDEIFSMNFFGNRLRPYWRHLYGDDPLAMIRDVTHRARELHQRARAFDAALAAELVRTGGERYATLASLAFRQTTGAMTVVWHEQRNRTWAFMKEISSDGDVSTVDVIYPAAPFFVYLAPETLRQLLLPLLAYANNETSVAYNLAWAPHHLGTWPVCDLRPDQQEQMPIEETANMLLMLAAVAGKQRGDVAWLERYWRLLGIWGDYLVSALPDPGNQLCTDDFEGPSPHNSNLAAKGIVGIGAYATLLRYAGRPDASASYRAVASSYAQSWLRLANDTNHYRLQYNLPGTWSLKYNVLFQPQLNLTLFPDSVFTLEQAFYAGKRNRYGVPLDNRATFTKTDWLAWTAALGTREQFASLVDAIYDYANASPDRVAFSDWYDTITAVVRGFRARPVIGGLYAAMMLHGASPRA